MAGQESSTASTAGSFTNPTIILCRPENSRLASCWNQQGGFEQAEDGPILLVIGSETDDAKCGRMGNRFGVEASRLRKFRDTPTLREVVVLGKSEVRHG